MLLNYVIILQIIYAQLSFRHWLQCVMRRRLHRWWVSRKATAFLIFLFIIICVSGYLRSKHCQRSDNSLNGKHALNATAFLFSEWSRSPIVRLDQHSNLYLRHQRNYSCNYYNCFNPYRCGFYGNDKLTVHVYPFQQFTDESGVQVNRPTREFLELLAAILTSKYYETDPERACIFVPAIDMLNGKHVRETETGSALNSLKWWNQGENHLLFHMFPGTNSNLGGLNTFSGNAIIAGAGFERRTYRSVFDISIPIFNPIISAFPTIEMAAFERRRWLLFYDSFKFGESSGSVLQTIADKFRDRILLLTACTTASYIRRCTLNGEVHSYVQSIQSSEFCLVAEGSPLAQTELFDALKFGCIPVIVGSDYVLPFQEVLDWKRASVLLYQHDLNNVISILDSLPKRRRDELRATGAHFFREYFSNMAAIALTTLRILSDRIFAHRALLYSDWNQPSCVKQHTKCSSVGLEPSRSLFMNRQVAEEGFTAVILAYDRLASLHRLIEQLSKSKHLRRIIVVWNNPNKGAPQAHQLATGNTEVRVLNPGSNKLSNRFIPYHEIETEAILSLDDDMTALNMDEIDFGYQVWRQFPEHLVGFVARLHVVDNATGQFRYESEWRNEFSLLLTAAAFYHKYYNYLFTYKLPHKVKHWVDSHMNCDDIAMNFLIANYTGKPAIKVGPRKKIRCPECTNLEIVTDAQHMSERSECINKFVKVFKRVPRSIVFRADPTLYKVDGPGTVSKMFESIGPL